MEIKALTPLVTISQLAASTKATLIELRVSNTDEITAVFTTEVASELNNLKAIFERSALVDVEIQIDQAKLKLILKAAAN